MLLLHHTKALWLTSPCKGIYPARSTTQPGDKGQEEVLAKATASPARGPYTPTPAGKAVSPAAPAHKTPLFYSSSSAPRAAPWAGVSNRDRNISSRCCHQIQHIIRLLAALNHLRARRFFFQPWAVSPRLSNSCETHGGFALAAK